MPSVCCQLKYFYTSFVRCIACCSNSNRKLEIDTHTHAYRYVHTPYTYTFYMCVYLSAPLYSSSIASPSMLSTWTSSWRVKNKNNGTIEQWRELGSQWTPIPLIPPCFPSTPPRCHSCCYYYAGISLTKYQKSRALSRAYLCAVAYLHFCWPIT